MITKPQESPAVLTLPLILLAIPSVAAGWTIGTVLYGGYLVPAIFIARNTRAWPRWRRSSTA
jgi:NADH-quinone oxidoreductase subunit L